MVGTKKFYSIDKTLQVSRWQWLREIGGDVSDHPQRIRYFYKCVQRACLKSGIEEL